MANFSYRLSQKLIVVPVILFGKRGFLESEFIFDTGASLTIVSHDLISALGYSARGGMGLSNISSVTGREMGYRLKIEGFKALDKKIKNFEVACHDFPDDGVEGLIGMSFLEQFKWCVDPKQQIVSRF